MRIRLDTERCQGHGRCYALAPDLFGCDDDGYATLLVDGDLPVGSESAAKLAVDSCPEFAITVE